MNKKDINPPQTGQVKPATKAPSTDEVQTQETDHVPTSTDDSSNMPSTEAPCSDAPNDTSKKKPHKKKKAKTDEEEGKKHQRQFGYRALDFSDWRNYIRVGFTFYLKYYKVDSSCHMTPALQPWSSSQLRRDFREAGRSRDIDLIPVYVGMGCYPSHTQFQENVCGMYNTYCRLNYQPEAGEWPTIKKMLRHIFGGQYEFGLDYVEMLYLYPTQMLPILLLVSKERQTGKTTFLNFLREVFGENATLVNNEALRSNFNAERAGKLLVMCDEAVQNKKEDSERLKALSTARKTYLEFKGKDRIEIDNYVKIVMCSNNVIDPVYIDPEEVRYWVREVPHIAEDDPGILEAMKREIPAFLFYLLHRPLSVPTAQSRMWFRPADLATPALARIKRMCRPTVELDLAEFLLDVMDHFGIDQVQYTNSDLQALLKAHGRELRDAHRIVAKVWDVPRANNKMAYDLYADWVTPTSRRAYGRYYTFTRSFLGRLVPDFSSSKPDNTPKEGKKVMTGSLFSE